jgi:hypothetical protein
MANDNNIRIGGNAMAVMSVVLHIQWNIPSDLYMDKTMRDNTNILWAYKTAITQPEAYLNKRITRLNTRKKFWSNLKENKLKVK